MPTNPRVRKPKFRLEQVERLRAVLSGAAARQRERTTLTFGNGLGLQAPHPEISLRTCSESVLDNRRLVFPRQCSIVASRIFVCRQQFLHIACVQRKGRLEEMAQHREPEIR